ncbi:MAG: hypothetical protein R2787_14710 [Saprospiraceae bacterium]
MKNTIWIVVLILAFVACQEPSPQPVEEVAPEIEQVEPAADEELIRITEESGNVDAALDSLLNELEN